MADTNYRLEFKMPPTVRMYFTGLLIALSAETQHLCLELFDIVGKDYDRLAALEARLKEYDGALQNESAVEVNILRGKIKLNRQSALKIADALDYDELKSENERLKDELARLTDESEPDQCDVEGCADEVSSQGNEWRETGYWCLCLDHSRLTDDSPVNQPQMKESAISREKSRDENGVLPIGVKR